MNAVRQVDNSYRYSHSGQANVRSLASVGGSIAISTRRLGVYTCVIYRDCQLYLLGINGSQRMNIGVLFRSLLRNGGGILRLLVYLVSLITSVGLRVRDCLIVATSSYIGLLSNVSSAISRIYLRRTISVLVLHYSLRLTYFRIYGSAIRSFYSLLLFFLYRSPLFYGRNGVYLTSASVLSMGFLVGKGKYIGVMGRLIHFFYGATSPWLYRVSSSSLFFFTTRLSSPSVRRLHLPSIYAFLY